MKKNICVLASLIMFVQAEAGCGGVRSKISPIINDIFVDATIKGLRKAGSELNLAISSKTKKLMPSDGTLVMRPQVSVARLFDSIRSLNSCGILYHNEALSSAVVSQLNSNKRIIACYQYANSSTIDYVHRHVAWLNYLREVDSEVARMQRARIPKFKNGVLSRKCLLKDQIRELVLKNQATELSDEEMDYFKATLVGKLGALEALSNDDSESFVHLYWYVCM